MRLRVAAAACAANAPSVCVTRSGSGRWPSLQRWLVQFSDAGHPEAMNEVTVSDARARLADVVDAARLRHDPVYLPDGAGE